MTATVSRLFERLERWGTFAENAALVVLLTGMILLAVGQIALRLFFSIGFVWADELISLIVLWIAVIASVAAARSDKHLRIDAISHFVPQKYARIPRIVVDGFAAGMCAVLAWQSWRYIGLLREFEEVVLMDVPAWAVFWIVPFAFLLIAYRFFLHAGKGALAALGVTDEDESREEVP